MDRVTKAVVNALRRISYLNVHRKDTTARVHVGRGQYKCEKCEGVFKRNDVHMDHIEPVIDPEIGWVDMNTFYSRLFYGKLQALCVTCHKAKTKEENSSRKYTRDWESIE